jgi:hypothetical protein
MLFAFLVAATVYFAHRAFTHGRERVYDASAHWTALQECGRRVVGRHGHDSTRGAA